MDHKEVPSQQYTPLNENLENYLILHFMIHKAERVHRFTINFCKKNSNNINITYFQYETICANTSPVKTTSYK